MFTGLVTDVGKLHEIDGGHMRVRTAYDPATIDLGASIAHDGCCLTVTDLEPVSGGGCIYGVDVGPETLNITTLGDWQPGRRINLERPLSLGAELGGHMVTGHVDGLGTLIERGPDGDSERFTIEIPRELARFIAAKGSVALNGTSLTVNEVTHTSFGICLIPHTLQVTNWNERKAGDKINLEIDLLARYVARLNEIDQLEKT